MNDEDKRPVGRPRKNAVDFHCQVQPATKEFIGLTLVFGMSQGEVIDFLARKVKEELLK
jgi:hypothetical protein